jgi:hypothetical protein
MRASAVQTDADSSKLLRAQVRPKQVAVCRESDSRRPAEFIAQRSQNDHKRDLACCGWPTLEGAFPLNASVAPHMRQTSDQRNASITSTDACSQQTYGPGETGQKTT